MKKNRWIARLLVLLVLAAALNATVSAAAEVGTSTDPLVTLSYLNDTYLNTILSKVDSKIAARNTELTAKLGTSSGTASSFTLVSLSKGQVLTGGVGCEVLLRVGTAACTATSAPGLIDETTGGSINNGAALTANHLYMATIENRGVKATAASVKLLVRGTYSIA